LIVDFKLLTLYLSFFVHTLKITRYFNPADPSFATALALTRLQLQPHPPDLETHHFYTFQIYCFNLRLFILNLQDTRDCSSANEASTRSSTNPPASRLNRHPASGPSAGTSHRPSTRTPNSHIMSNKYVCPHSHPHLAAPKLNLDSRIPQLIHPPPISTYPPTPTPLS